MMSFMVDSDLWTFPGIPTSPFQSERDLMRGEPVLRLAATSFCFPPGPACRQNSVCPIFQQNRRIEPLGIWLRRYIRETRDGTCSTTCETGNTIWLVPLCIAHGHRCQAG